MVRGYWHGKRILAWKIRRLQIIQKMKKMVKN